jgi:Butirosin biosynthesis protein H, N-terminal/Domain of unknown function (DUF4872)
MTIRKHFKKLVRARMQKTRESYATARRQVLGQTLPDKPTLGLPWHFPGSVPAATALRVLLTHAGVRNPKTGEPYSEAMLFGIAGGIGIGIFSFFYEKEGWATFFIAGRHLWHDHKAYLTQACARFDIEPVVQETAGAKAGEAALRAALSERGTCVAWVDAAHLPHRALPGIMSGGGYHIVTVYGIDESAGTALIGDLTDDPLTISLADLAIARARIKKDKHRLLSIPAAQSPGDLTMLVRHGLHACHSGLGGAGGIKSAAKNFSLEAVRVWAERLNGSNDNERWERVFERGPRLWQGLVSVYDYIEHHGGGGLSRPLFAEFLTEAAESCGDSRLKSLATRYAELGQAWSELADAALPDSVSAFREAKELHARKAELTNSGGSIDEIRATWAQLGELRSKVCDQFPLTEQECTELRAGLQTRVRALYEGEIAARDALGKAIA